MRAALSTGDYHLVATGIQGIDPFWLADYFTQDGPANWSGTSSSVLDSVLRDALLTRDERARFGLYARAQQIIMDDALILPLREHVNIMAHAEALAGLEWDPAGEIPLFYNLTWLGSAAES